MVHRGRGGRSGNPVSWVTRICNQQIQPDVVKSLDGKELWKNVGRLEDCSIDRLLSPPGVMKQLGNMTRYSRIMGGLKI